MRNTILVADTEQSDRALLKEMFRREYRIVEAENQDQGIEYLQQDQGDVAIVLMDSTNQEVAGCEMLRYMRESGLQEQIPVILIMSSEEDDWADQDLDLGVIDVIDKPFRPEIVKRRVHNIIQLYQNKTCAAQLLSDQEKEESRRCAAHYIQIEEVLCNSICRRNAESMRHIHYVEAYTRIIAEHYARLFPRARMTADKINMITKAARMHDVGKLLLPDFLIARPGRLTDSELELLKEHTELGCSIMEVLTEFQSVQFHRICQNVCRYHHERYDGFGYPEGLQKDKIPLEAQIVALADMYDVLVNAAIDGKRNTKERAYNMLMNGECGELSPRMQESLKHAKEEMEAFSLEEPEQQLS